ncbi:unnamed protein product [Bursaphelenchus okinawaensis]|uniref:Large ribosomal subunit protein mL40 n=1 Tax=Bursaphelenchus okinawaensis TaxID=465554 RepID=A0A811KLR6_9BILA|nr:unnamed protein product [Bursaphelenchus okinawaensis]CAG9104823.1 unnamed protein product [Bursaphelenchus okinawaensis]
MLGSLVHHLTSLSVRNFLRTSVASASVFTKKTKKVDTDVAKAREARKRKKLTREIREMMKHSKKPKPVTELTVDVKSARNIDLRYREPSVLSEAEMDDRAIITKAYNTSRNILAHSDIRWIQTAIKEQDEAMNLLKSLSPDLYKAAASLSEGLSIYEGKGPMITPPLKEYRSPDGDYEDTTRTWE